MPTLTDEQVRDQRTVPTVRRKEASKCESERAFLELVGEVTESSERGACSPEAAESRAYPPPIDGGRPYFLCNGHLRDLFDARDRHGALHKAIAPAVQSDSLP
jgi:hypothetical protein